MRICAHWSDIRFWGMRRSDCFLFCSVSSLFSSSTRQSLNIPLFGSLTSFFSISFSRALRMLVWPTKPPTRSERPTGVDQTHCHLPRPGNLAVPLDPLSTPKLDVKLINSFTPIRESEEDALTRTKVTPGEVDELEMGTFQSNINIDRSVNTTHLTSPSLAEQFRARSATVTQQILLSAL
jgi:hypothetical protein